MPHCFSGRQATIGSLLTYKWLASFEKAFHQGFLTSITVFKIHKSVFFLILSRVLLLLPQSQKSFQGLTKWLRWYITKHKDLSSLSLRIYMWSSIKIWVVWVSGFTCGRRKLILLSCPLASTWVSCHMYMHTYKQTTNKCNKMPLHPLVSQILAKLGGKNILNGMNVPFFSCFSFLRLETWKPTVTVLYTAKGSGRPRGKGPSPLRSHRKRIPRTLIWPCMFKPLTIVFLWFKQPHLFLADTAVGWDFA